MAKTGCEKTGRDGLKASLSGRLMKAAEGPWGRHAFVGVVSQPQVSGPDCVKSHAPGLHGAVYGSDVWEWDSAVMVG